jgi:uncharacterized protein YjbI with pentapeptide repeats
MSAGYIAESLAREDVISIIAAAPPELKAALQLLANSDLLLEEVSDLVHSKVRAIDDTTIEVKLTRPVGTGIERLLRIVGTPDLAAHVLAERSARPDHPFLDTDTMRLAISDCADAATISLNKTSVRAATDYGFGPSPTRERLNELRGALERGDLHIQLVNRLEVMWALKSPERQPSKKQRVDLHRFDAHGLKDLCAIDMSWSNWDGANLDQTDLSHSYFIEASLCDSSLKDAQLGTTDFRGAVCTGATLRGATLAHANLDAIWLNKADNRNANMELATLLHANIEGMWIGPGTTIAGVSWPDKGLGLVNWDPVLANDPKPTDKPNPLGKMRPGTDVSIGKAPRTMSRDEKAAVADSYKGLREALEGQDRHAAASAFRFAQLQATKESKGFLSQLPWLVLELTCGYGERVNRAVVGYGIVVCGFIPLYILLGTWKGNLSGPCIDGPRCGWVSVWHAFTLSVVAAQGRGFGASGSEAVGELAAIEAIFGLVMEVLVIATLTRRLFQLL